MTKMTCFSSILLFTGAFPSVVLGEPDPLLQKVLASSLTHAGLSVSRDGEEMRRARVAAMLPDVQLKFDSERGLLERNSLDGAELRPASSFDTTSSRKSSLSVGMGIRWRLSELLYSRVEAQLSALRHRRLKTRLDIINRVTSAYLLWQEATRLRPLSDEKEHERRTSQKVASITRLDALTGGEFSRLLDERGAQ